MPPPMFQSYAGTRDKRRIRVQRRPADILFSCSKQRHESQPAAPPGGAPSLGTSDVSWGYPGGGLTNSSLPCAAHSMLSNRLSCRQDLQTVTTFEPAPHTLHHLPPTYIDKVFKDIATASLHVRQTSCIHVATRKAVCIKHFKGCWRPVGHLAGQALLGCTGTASRHSKQAQQAHMHAVHNNQGNARVSPRPRLA